MPAVGCDGPKSHHTWFDLTSIKSPTDGKAALEGFLTAIAGDTTVAVSQLKAAGVPSVDNGSQVASAFVAGFTRLETALKQAASKAQSLPTTSASVFKSAAFALGSDVKGSMGDIGQSAASRARSWRRRPRRPPPAPPSPDRRALLNAVPARWAGVSRAVRGGSLSSACARW